MIYVFKTSVKTKSQARKLKPHINSIVKEGTWNFDLDDCDNILRIDSAQDVVSSVMNLMNEHHFICEELE